MNYSLLEHPNSDKSSVSQFLFSFYHHRPVWCDFSGGQITSDAGLLPLLAFDELFAIAVRNRRLLRLNAAAGTEQNL
jgi:hypothetical protein